MSRIKKRQLQRLAKRCLSPGSLLLFRLLCCFAEQKADLPRLAKTCQGRPTDLPHALVSWQLISHVFWKSKTPKKNLNFVSKLDFS